MALEQHPVPQNISSYEFRLVGDMTLKQFLQLAGGVVLAIVIYRLPIAGIFKYPLVFLVVLVGVIMAFVPINNRPFTQWLFAFFHAIYAPTEYYWSPSPVATEIVPTPAPTVSPPSPIQTTAPAEVVAPSPVAVVPSEEKPISRFPTAATSMPATMTTPLTPPPSETVSTHAVYAAPPPAPVVAVKEVPKAPPPSQSATTTPPQPAPEPVPPPPPPPVTIPVAPKTPPPPPPAPSAVTTSSLTPPSQPNILSGIAVDPSGQALSAVTVEIVDKSSGVPARALRTNRLGQFQIAIPLPAGEYVINADKPGFVFDPSSVLVSHSAIIQPIILTAKPV